MKKVVFFRGCSSIPEPGPGEWRSAASTPSLCCSLQVIRGWGTSPPSPQQPTALYWQGIANLWKRNMPKCILDWLARWQGVSFTLSLSLFCSPLSLLFVFCFEPFLVYVLGALPTIFPTCCPWSIVCTSLIFPLSLSHKLPKG